MVNRETVPAIAFQTLGPHIPHLQGNKKNPVAKLLTGAKG